MDALGFLEVQGFTTAISVADAMLKSANVVLLPKHEIRPGILTVVVSGDLAACRAAVSAGLAAAEQVGKVIAHHVIGRLDEDVVLNTLISTGQTCEAASSLLNVCQTPATLPMPTSVTDAVTVIAQPEQSVNALSPRPLEVKKSLDPMLVFITSAPQGKTMKQIKQQFTNQKTRAIQAKLMMWVKAGQLIKKGERYYPFEIKAI